MDMKQHKIEAVNNAHTAATLCEWLAYSEVVTESEKQDLKTIYEFLVDIRNRISKSMRTEHK